MRWPKRPERAEKPKGVTVVPDDMPAAERAALEAEGHIVVSASEAANGPADFDG
jgi:hypothetical protein